MEQVGKVVRTQNKMAEVQIRRTTACGGDCGKCGGCFPTKMVIWAKNTAHAEEGQMVKLDSSTRNILSAAFMLYIMPIILLIGSYIITQEIITTNQYPVSVEGTGIIVGIIVLILFFVFIRLIDQRISKSNKLQMEITRIIE